MAFNPIMLELQAVQGALTLAKKTLDDVQNKVTAGPGPIQNPDAITLLAAIATLNTGIVADTTQLQTIANPTGGSPVGTT